MSHTKREWLELLGIKEYDIPELLVLEGTWWDKTAYQTRLAYLDEVKEVKFPNMFLGKFGDRKVMFSCAYGAPRAVEPIHIFGTLGTPIVVQIGSCGSLQQQVKTGDIVVPNRAKIGEGASQYYQSFETSYPDTSLASQAVTHIEQQHVKAHEGFHLTTSALFQQNLSTVESWTKAGFLSVDMETSAVFSAARYFGMRAVSLVFVWDELQRGRTWLDSFSREEIEKHNTANRVTYETALTLI